MSDMVASMSTAHQNHISSIQTKLLEGQVKVQMIHFLMFQGDFWFYYRTVLWTWPTNKEHDWRCQQANANMELGT